MRRWLAMVLCAVLLVGVLPVVAGADESGLQVPVGPGEGQGPPALGNELTMDYVQTHTIDFFYNGNDFRGKNNKDKLSCSGVIKKVDVVTTEDDYTTWELTVREPGDGTVTYNDGTYTSSVTIHYTDLFAGMTKLSQSSQTVSANERAIIPDDDNMGPVPFAEIEGTTYYVGPAWYEQNYNDPLFFDSMGYREGETDVWKFHIGFWTTTEQNDQKEYCAVKESEVLNYFKSLTLTMEATNDGCVKYPEMYQNEASTQVFANVSYDSAGAWLLHVHGEIKDAFNGNTNIEAYGTATFIAQYREVNEPSQINNFPDDINNYFSQKAADPHTQNNDIYTFVIPAGTYNGTITTPKTDKNVTFEVVSAEKATVTINGGVIANATNTALYDLNFTGQTDGRESSDKDCITGTGKVTFWNCTFSGFNRAIVCDRDCGLRWGSKGCTFENNHIALYMNTYVDDGGNNQMIENIFRNNDIALEFVHFSPRLGIYAHHINRCQFINNTCDVRNMSGRTFFMPGNYFNHAENVGSIAVCPGSTGKVSAFPIAKDTTFKEFNYDETAPIVSTRDTSEYTIPSSSLAGKTITVVDQEDNADNTLGIWTFAGGN